MAALCCTVRVLSVGLSAELMRETTPEVTVGSRAAGSFSFRSTSGTVIACPPHRRINPGNSGGPLFDKCGNVMGVNTLVALNSQGLFSSIHASEVVRILREYGIDYAWVHDPVRPPVPPEAATMMIPLVIGMSAALALAALVFALKSGANLGGLSQYVSRLSGRAPSPRRRDDRDREPPATPRSARQQVDWAKSGGNFTLQSTTGGNSFAIEGGRVLVVGRGHKAQIVIDDDTVSSMHARLQLSSTGERVTMTDLGSSNGTYINGKRITTGQAQAGDVMRFGTAELKWMAGGSSSSAAPARAAGRPQPRLDAGPPAAPCSSS